MGPLIRRGLTGRALTVTVAALAGVAAVASMTAATPAGAATTSRWRTRYEYRASYGQLDSIVAPGRNDAWAAGALSNSGGNLFEPFVVHWNGGRWRRAAIPGARNHLMQTVAASSARDVWIFGSQRNIATYTVFRWNGSRWSTMRAPVGYADVLGRGNAWSIAGTGCWQSTDGATHCRTDIEHWNGKRWAHLTAPGRMTDLSGTAKTGIYAIGKSTRGRLAAYHWARRHWVPLPMAHPQVRDSLGIHVASPRNIWISVNSRGRQDYALHWNGTRWRRTPAVTAGLTYPAVANANNIVPDSHGGVWLQAWHWTGRAWIDTWKTAPSGTGYSLIVKVAGTAGSYWAAGLRYGSYSSHPIVAGYGPLP